MSVRIPRQTTRARALDAHLPRTAGRGGYPMQVGPPGEVPAAWGARPVGPVLLLAVLLVAAALVLQRWWLLPVVPVVAAAAAVLDRLGGDPR